MLLLHDGALVKTTAFDQFRYIGDPSNTVRIFNELEVDELMLLDILATPLGRGPDIELLANVAQEAFMPLSYGGGIRSLKDASSVFGCGFEKVVVNSAAVDHPDLISTIANVYGSQAVVVSIDVRRNRDGTCTVHTHSGETTVPGSPADWARRLEECGAGEILLTSIDREGSWGGLDLDLLQSVSRAVSVPVVAHGGCGSLSDIGDALRIGGASAVGTGSMVTFQRRGMGVLVNFPSPAELAEEFK